MDFQEWRAKQRAKLDGAPDAEEKSPKASFAGFVLAERCGHPLHPRDPRLEAQDQREDESDEEGKERDTIAWCPMCILQIHLKLLGELWEKWMESGGPWRILPLDATSENFQVGKRAYYKRKTDLVNNVDDLEDIARLEASWEAANPTVDTEFARSYSADSCGRVCKGRPVSCTLSSS